MGIGSGRMSGRRAHALLLLVLSVLFVGKTGNMHALPGDADSDGMPDAWETFFGLDRTTARTPRPIPMATVSPTCRNF
jgi:hypothetical protein